MKNKILEMRKDYSVFVYFAKRFLVIASFILLLLLFLLPYFTNNSKQIEIGNKNNTHSDSDYIVIDDVKLKSNNKKFGKYQLIAKKLNQKQDKNITLEEPILYLYDLLSSEVVMQSNRGFVFDDNLKIKLYNDVEVRTTEKNEEYKIRTEQMLLDLDKFELLSLHKTLLLSLHSEIISESGFIAYLNDKYAIFTGKIFGNILNEKNNKIIKFVSNFMKLNWLKNTISINGNVEILYDDLKIYADIVESEYIKNKKSFEKIYFYKNIKFVSKENIVYCDKGYYDIKLDKIVLINNVRLIKDKNEIDGNRFVYLNKEKRGYMENDNSSRVKANIKIKHHEK